VAEFVVLSLGSIPKLGCKLDPSNAPCSDEDAVTVAGAIETQETGLDQGPLSHH
jgi:hypothetical protein